MELTSQKERYKVTTNCIDLPNMVLKKIPITEAIETGLKHK